MKFLCPSCKAKYQIADEKVVGRTVKMKCRQCGHFIEINEAVTGNVGNSEGPPPKVLDLGVAPPQAEPNKPEAKKPEPLKPEPAPDGDVELGARSNVPAKPARAPSAGVAERPRKPSKLNPAATRSPLPAPPERPRTPAVGAPRPGGAVRSGTSQATPTPAARKPAKPTSTESRSGEPEQAAPPSSRPRTGTRTSAEKNVAAKPEKPDGSAVPVGRLPGVPEAVATSLGAALGKDALAGAFTKAVTEISEKPEPPEHPLAGDEWYIGINDVPIGPIRLAEIRDRAAKGEVSQECLVWRDGFEDWKPLSAFPELVAVVEEGIASLRSQVSAPVVPGAPGAGAPVLQARIHPELAAALSPSTTGTAPAAPVVLDEEALAAAGLPKQKIPLTAWLAVAAALAFGITLGLVLIPNEPPKQVIKYIEVPASAKQAAPSDNGAATPRSEGAPNAEQLVVAQKQNGVAARKSNSASTEAAPAPSSGELTQGLKGLQGLQAVGPRSGPATEVGAQSGARQQLDSATLSRTVSRYTASVKRSCWQPALDARAPDAATSARISANIVVAPSGKVQTVTVSPDPKGYRGLSSCIQARVRNWEFPPAGGPTEFNVPFVFAAQ